MNYLDLLELAFNQNPLKTIIYCLPAIFLLFLGIGGMVISFTPSYRNENPTDMADAILKAGNGTGMFVAAFIICLMGGACIPTLKWVEVRDLQSKNIINEVYAQELSQVNKDSDSVFSLLESNEREFTTFKKQVAEKLPQGQYITKKSIQNILKNQHALFLNCMENKKNAYLEESIKKTLVVEYIKEDIEKFAPDCSVIIGQYILANHMIK